VDWLRHAIKLAAEETLTAPPGRRFVYSDINFELLAEVIARVSKQPFDVSCASGSSRRSDARDDVQAVGDAAAADRAD
jgi:hypothetical protein